MTVDQLNVIITAQTAGLRQEMSKLRAQFKGFQTQVQGVEKQVSTSTGRMSGAMKAMGKAALAALSVRAIVNFGKEAVALASDLQEVENVVTTSFGSMTEKVDAWAKTTVDKFGMSELSAKRTASTYMAMSKGLGLAGRQAADMAMEVAERTGDIASFYNMSQQEADTMLKSIWTGETESLKRIGVVMTQTNLDAYALANGFGKTTDAMTQAEQVMLRYQYVMSQTGLAAGDFEKTSGSWANQTRVLSERIKELMAVLGSGLIQVMTPLIQMLNTIVLRLTEAAKTAMAFLSALFGSNGAEEGIGSAAENAGAIAGNMEGASKAAKELKKTVAGFDELNVLSDSGVVSTGSLSVISDEDLARLESYQQSANEARTALTLPDSVKKGWETIRTFMENTFTTLKETAGEVKKVVWDSFLVPLGEWAGEKIIEAMETINEKLDEFGRWCEDHGITLEKLGDGLAVIAGALEKIIEHLGNSIFEEWKKFLEDMEEPLKEVTIGVNNLVTSFSDLITSIEELDETSKILEVVFYPFQQGIAVLRTALSGLLTFLAGIFSAAAARISGALTVIQGVVEMDSEKIMQGIGLMATGIVNEIISVINLVIDALNLALKNLAAPIRNIAKVIDAIPGVDVPDWVYDFEIPKVPKLKVPVLDPVYGPTQLPPPKLASGGLAYGPTLAMIGEGRDREAVLPLNNNVYAEIARGINAQTGNTAVVNLLEKLLRAVETIDPNVELTIDDRGIARMANRGNQRLGYKVANVYG